MKIKVTTAFEDLHEQDETKRLRAVDTEMTVTKERGEYLVGLGLAEPVTDVAPAGDTKPPKN